MKNQDILKNEDNLKNQDDLKNENNLKNEDDLNKIICPPLREYCLIFFLMTSNQEMYQVFKPEMELHMINIIYAALPISKQIEKTTFSCKDD